MSEAIPLVRRRVDESHYEVSALGVILGEVYRDPGAWSYRPWFILGDRVVSTPGGVGGRTVKPEGFRSYRDASSYLLLMASGRLLSRLP